MSPLTRRESQAQTRERLLDAAAEVFAERGFGAAPLEEIAERAGFSRGAVYSNFEDKDDLFLALLARSSDQMVAELDEMLAGVTTLPELTKAFDRLGRWQGMDRQRWVVLFNEFRTHAMREPSVQVRLAAHERNIRALYERLVINIAAFLDIELPVPTAEVAAWLHAVSNGVEILHQIDPDNMPRDTMVRAIAFVFQTARTS